ncbi:hypothetical protein [Streptomyces sp. NPDC002057]|uniref:hypothetical protein n=1 Tax=Streptomyces sp. NPDC002057 TaxID=3154664 RepID=UPI00332535BE
MPATFTVPLPTGGTVTVERKDTAIRSATVTPAPGRPDVAFTTSSVGSDDMSVVPADAEAMLAAGRVDPSLFDVKALLETAYGTKGSTTDATVGLIVQHAKGSGAADKARRAVGGASSRPAHTISRLGMTAFDLHDGVDAATTWKRLTAGTGRSLAGGVNKLWLDGRLRVALDKSVPQIHGPEAWESGYTGKGVAVLDSGYDSDHPGLAGRVTVSSNFLGGASAEDGQWPRHARGLHERRRRQHLPGRRPRRCPLRGPR